MEVQTIIAMREKAAELRRLAAIPTNGGHIADRMLLLIADQLDHEADEREGTKHDE